MDYYMKSGSMAAFESARNIEDAVDGADDYFAFKRKYKNNCPLDRALIVIYEGQCLVLDYIGSSLEYLENQYGHEYMQNEIAEDCNIEPGVYIWEGTIKRDPPDYYGEPGDEYLDGTFRFATKQEWEDHIKDMYPWDPDLWIENERDRK
jgi:hypothetical protein